MLKNGRFWLFPKKSVNKKAYKGSPRSSFSLQSILNCYICAKCQENRVSMGKNRVSLKVCDHTWPLSANRDNVIDAASGPGGKSSVTKSADLTGQCTKEVAIWVEGWGIFGARKTRSYNQGL